MTVQLCGQRRFSTIAPLWESTESISTKEQPDGNPRHADRESITAKLPENRDSATLGEETLGRTTRAGDSGNVRGVVLQPVGERTV
jgi:hypothetical protein